jgi:hypothetical protein
MRACVAAPLAAITVFTLDSLPRELKTKDDSTSSTVFSPSSRIISREATDNSGQVLSGAQEFHFHRGRSTGLKAGNLRNREFILIKQDDGVALPRAERAERPVENLFPPALVNPGFEIGRFCNEAFIYGFEISRSVTSTPMVVDRVLNHFSKECTRLLDVICSPESNQRAQDGFLREVLIEER